MCMHAGINEIEVGFVMLISGNLRLGSFIELFQTCRKHFLSKLLHWLILDILRWSFLESKHWWYTSLHISLSHCSRSEELTESSQGRGDMQQVFI